MVKNMSQYFLSILILCVAIFDSELLAANITNTHPAIKILSPQNGTVFQVGENINFQGSAFDLEDGKLPNDRMIWKSDIDNYLGKGNSFYCDKLSPGSHIITLTVKDLQHFEDSDRIFISVKSKPEPQAVEKPKNERSKGLSRVQNKIANRLSDTRYKPFDINDGNDIENSPLTDKITIEIYIAKETDSAAQTYNVKNIYRAISLLCKENSIEFYIGSMLGVDKTENQNELNTLISISRQKLDCIKALIVGSDVLLRRDITEDELISHIRRIKQSTTLPVTTGQMWLLWLKYPRLAQEVDFLLVYVNPYWEGIAIGKAAQHVVKACKYLQGAFPEKKIVVGETGWPSTGKTIGKAVPSAKNQAKFQEDLKRLLIEEGFDYFYHVVSEPLIKKAQEREIEQTSGTYKPDGLLRPYHKQFLSRDYSRIKTDIK